MSVRLCAGRKGSQKSHKPRPDPGVSLGVFVADLEVVLLDLDTMVMDNDDAQHREGVDPTRGTRGSGLGL